MLLPETDYYPSWISGREKMTIENISWSISMKECCRPGRGQTPNLLITSQTDIQLSHQGWHLFLFWFKNKYSKELGVQIFQPWLFCSFWSRSTLFHEACLSHCIGISKLRKHCLNFVGSKHLSWKIITCSFQAILLQRNLCFLLITTNLLSGSNKTYLIHIFPISALRFMPKQSVRAIK